MDAVASFHGETRSALPARGLTGQRYPARPVVVFPGWFVERSARPTARDVWVLEPKELRGWLAREPHMIAPKDVALIHSRLKLVAR